MEKQGGSALDVIFENWGSYQKKLRDCITAAKSH